MSLPLPPKCFRVWDFVGGVVLLLFCLVFNFLISLGQQDGIASKGFPPQVISLYSVTLIA